MRNLLLSILFLPSVLFAEGPRFSHKDTIAQQEFENVYQDIRTIRGSSGSTFSDGTPASPSITFTDDSNTGLFRDSSGKVGYSSNGSTTAVFGSNGISVANGAVTGPSVYFYNDTDSGLWLTGTNSIGVAAGAVQVASFTSSGSFLKGTNTNNNADSGWVGEYVSTTSSNYNTIAASGQYFDVLSFTLTAGDWDLDGSVGLNRNGATFSNTNQIEICTGGTSSGNSSAGCTWTLNYASYQDVYPTSFSIITMSTSRSRISLSASTTLYLKGYASTITSGTAKVRGTMTARRVR